MAAVDDLSLAHLQAELARVDVRIQREVLRWQRAGQDPHDAFRGLKVSDDEALALAHRPFGTSWGQTTALGDEAQAFAAAEAEAARQAAALGKRAAKAGQALRLRRLGEAFGLDAFALDAFLICLAPTLDLRYERLYGYLQDDVTRRRPTVNLILDLLCEPGPERLRRLRAFADDAPLLAFNLVERVADPGGPAPSLLGQALTPNEAVVGWLLGDYQPHADLGRHAQWVRPEAGPEDRVLAGPAVWELVRLARGDEGRRTNDEGRRTTAGGGQEAEEGGGGGMGAKGGLPPVAVLYGPNGAAQEAALRLFAAEAGRPLLRVALGRLVGGERTALRVVRTALRDARLTGAIPCIVEWDAALGGAEAGAGAGLADVLDEVFSYPDMVVLAGHAAWQPRGAARDRRLAWVEFPVPDFEHRAALWEHFARGRLEQAGEPEALGDLGLADLAGQFTLTAGQIADAVAAAADRAAQQGRPVDRADLFQAARGYSSPGLATLAHKLAARYTWDDIVLPVDQVAILREIISTVRGRPQVLEAWGVGEKLASSAGVTVLFAGPPGTGKTMAAEVIASELGLELYRIDLSTVVNKYIGETEKNLSRIFDEAASSNAILFFDEADAIFGKRSEVKDAHDRYANIEVSYLLQRMETYDGVTVLATNLRANLDEAFTRRLQFAVDFPFPDEAYRLRIWETLFPPGVPRGEDLDFRLLARRFKLAGGNIRNIIISAAYLAAADGGQVNMGHLLHGARRELQKMGRLIKEHETGR